MKRKVYLVVEQAFADDNFAYERDRKYFTSKNTAALWMEREKINLIHEGWTIIFEDIDECRFSVIQGNTKKWFYLWSGIPQ